MAKKSIFYKHPLLYIWGLKWIHKGNFAKRYRYMASFVKKDDLVLEPACGPATLADFLPKEADYYGFDTNKDFTDYALKKHPGVYLGNVLDLKSYKQSDVVIACDILHHLKPADRQKFIKNCFSSTKKVFIICEPGKREKSTESIFKSQRDWLAEWSEKDGTNNFKVEHFLTRNKLINQIKHGFGVIPVSIEREKEDFGEDIVAVFFKDPTSRRRIQKQKLISAIVPVFNEEKTVAKVVKTLLKSDLIDEVICVNDGSTDMSIDIIKRFKDEIQIVDLKKNHGKGFALVKGIKKAKGEIVTFIDADLTNLSEKYINTLIQPILNSNKKAVLGYPSKNSLVPAVFMNLTGERAYYKKDLLPHLDKMATSRFGVEVFLNKLFSKRETKKVPLKGLTGLYKYEKHGSSNAFKEYLGEAIEIAQQIGRQEGLLPADKQIIDRLSRITDFSELKEKVRKIHNKQIRQFFDKYILKYIKIND
jgi:glycosyltransferase involved in cell wall biosynthesis